MLVRASLGLLRGGFGKGNFIIKNEGTPEEKYDMKMGTGDRVGDGKTAILGPCFYPLRHYSNFFPWHS